MKLALLFYAPQTTVKFLWYSILQQFGRCAECGSWGPHEITAGHETAYIAGFGGSLSSMPADITTRTSTCACGHELYKETVRINGAFKQ